MLYVIKNNGDKAKFEPEKIRSTCLRAGASDELTNEIIKRITEKAYNGITTKEILKMALKMLERDDPPAAARYDMKGAIMRLGPAGFIFEDLVSEVLKEYGYETKVHSILQGACIPHEVDIIASKKSDGIKNYMIECKYHNVPGIYTGSKDALYTYARFLDLVDAWKKGKGQKFDKPWLVTNTRFSIDTIQYSICKGMLLTGWKYPQSHGLNDMIEEKRLYPITVLRNLDTDSMGKMAAAGLLLCKDLLTKTPNKLQQLTGISQRKLFLLVQEANKVLYYESDSR